MRVSDSEGNAIFQSTLPREERLIQLQRYQNLRDFNPRSHERSDGMRWRHHGPGQDFNPRSHERSDAIEDEMTYQEEISIHAPTRGATAILHKKFVYFYTIPTINI